MIILFTCLIWPAKVVIICKLYYLQQGIFCLGEIIIIFKVFYMKPILFFFYTVAIFTFAVSNLC